MEREEATETTDAGEQVAVIDNGEGDTDVAADAAEDVSPAESAARAERLRGLDEEITRRGSELRGAGRRGGGRFPAASAAPRSQQRSAEDARERASEQLARTEEWAREAVYKVSGRVEALETSLQESQRRNWQELRSQQEGVAARLAQLEVATRQASEGATSMEERVGDTIETMSARIESLAGELRDSRRRTDAELRAQHDLLVSSDGARETEAKAIDERLTRLDEAGTEAAERDEQLKAQVAESTKALDERAKVLETSLGELERHSAERDHAERAVAESTIALDERAKALETGLGELERRSAERDQAEQAAAEERAAKLEQASRESKEAMEALEQRFLEQVDRLSGRLDSLGKELLDARRHTGGELRAQQQTLEGSETARATAAKEIQGRLERLEQVLNEASGRGQRAEGRLEGVEQALGDAAERGAKTQARMERLERALGEAAERGQQLDERLGETLEVLAGKVETLDGRLREAEAIAAASDELLKAAAGPSRPDPRRASRGKDDRLDLNAATFEDIRGLGLSVTQAARLVAHRDARGGFSSIGQLDNLAGLPKKEVRQLKRRAFVQGADG